jgi:ATP-dependent helicase HrpA
LIAPPEPVLPLKQAGFEAALERVRARIPGLVPGFVDQTVKVLQARVEIVRHRAFPTPVAPGLRGGGVAKQLSQLATPGARPSQKGLAFLAEELARLLPKDFLASIPFERLPHLPRYLKALQVRADRALSSPAKEAEKAAQVRSYVEMVGRLGARPDLTSAARQALRAYRWLLEEYKVSVFAQELGTAQPVSPKRLEAQLELIKTL